MERDQGLKTCKIEQDKSEYQIKAEIMRKAGRPSPLIRIPLQTTFNLANLKMYTLGKFLLLKIQIEYRSQRTFQLTINGCEITEASTPANCQR